jgi:hypothetical protein
MPPFEESLPHTYLMAEIQDGNMDVNEHLKAQLGSIWGHTVLLFLVFVLEPVQKISADSDATPYLIEPKFR